MTIGTRTYSEWPMVTFTEESKLSSHAVNNAHSHRANDWSTDNPNDEANEGSFLIPRDVFVIWYSGIFTSCSLLLISCLSGIILRQYVLVLMGFLFKISLHIDYSLTPLVLQI